MPIIPWFMEAFDKRKPTLTLPPAEPTPERKAREHAVAERLATSQPGTLTG